uniref:Uncharacterized protein n=1 Tax=Hemiselmis andersenii TaxID=464988 RepID=A0A6U2D3D2_HEMAN|mmetsp:Transcript_23175/g.53809  ORF Transcript_23175/g.53809 Transcript_23175/m.53809 type:complete len:194 (-) Transcript_23175:96-677(-)
MKTNPDAPAVPTPPKDGRVTSQWVAKNIPNDAVSVRRRMPSLIVTAKDQKQASFDMQSPVLEIFAPSQDPGTPRDGEGGEKASSNSWMLQGAKGMVSSLARGRRKSWAMGDGKDDGGLPSTQSPQDADESGEDSPGTPGWGDSVGRRGLTSLRCNLSKGLEKLASLSTVQASGGARQRQLDAMSGSMAALTAQ